MDVFGNLLLGFSTILEPSLLMYCFIGVFLGTFIGVLPGIGPLTATTLLLPFTFHLDPLTAIVMLAGIYYGSEYGGSTSSILLNLPGTVGNAVTCIDGYQMSKQGRAGIALFITTISSFVGGMIGIFSLVLLSSTISSVGLMFGPAEYFSLMILGLISASVLSVKSPIKGFSMVLVGLLLGTIGTDINSGVPRFSFGIAEMMDGIGLVILAIAFFGISEIINSVSAKRDAMVARPVTLRSMIPSTQDVKTSILPTLRGSSVGTFFGALPGTGAAVAAFVSYSLEKKISKNPKKFGNGAIEGVSSPEAANNAAAQSSFIPTLTLGIPGSATMAIILGALLIHGIQPGPTFITNQPELFWGLVVSFLIGNIMLVILNIPMIGIWVSLLKTPKRILYPIILSLMMVGVYSISKNTFDIYLLGIFGGVGYILLRCDYEFAPLLLGFVLGPLMEENLRRALVISRGDLTTFIDRPISASILFVCSIIIIFSILNFFMKRRS
jgi:TctA family transporter